MKMERGRCLDDERCLFFINPNLVKNFAFAEEKPISRFKKNAPYYIKRKTDGCKSCFKQCEAYPVSVSNLMLENDKISFVDGTTRFGYLMSINAIVIPVEASIKRCDKINRLYGYSCYKPRTLASFY